MISPLAVLRQYWGYSSFRPLQEKVIQSVLDGYDTVAIMPTGGGKSLTYQVPALMLPGLTIVVTPLVALMQDQVQQLRQRHIAAAALHSGLTRRQRFRILDQARQGKLKLLYIAPERIALDQGQWFRDLAIDLIAVDEAHCISQWGHDFRPSYRDIPRLREAHPKARILAVTATAPPRVLQDMVQALQLKDSWRLFKQSPARDNLALRIIRGSYWADHLLTLLRQNPGSTLIYVRSRQGTEQLAHWLQKHGIRAAFYHAGLSDAERQARQEAWTTNQIPVMVCTTAFGMGIDKPDVRLIVHVDIPPDPESYFQEVGRAGRDGQPAMAVLYAHEKNRRRLQAILREKTDFDFARKVYDLLCTYLQVPLEQGQGWAFSFKVEDFIQRYQLPARATWKALDLLRKAGYIEWTGPVAAPARVRILARRRELYRFRVEHPRWAGLLEALLRLVPGIMERVVPVPMERLAQVLKATVQEVDAGLRYLAHHRIIEYHPAIQGMMLVLLRDRVAGQHLRFPIQEIRQLEAARRERAQWMLDYVQHPEPCAMQRISQYFDPESSVSACGQCEACRRGADAQEAILQLLRTRGPLSTGTLVALLNQYAEVDVLQGLSRLRAEGQIRWQGQKWTLV